MKSAHHSFDNYIKKDLIHLLEAYEEALNSSVICSVINPDGIVKYANRKFSEVSKYSNRELVGVDHSLINSEMHPASFLSDIWRSVKKGKTWQGEVMDKTKDGKLYWVNSVIIPMLDGDGKIYQYLCMKTLLDNKMKSELGAEKKVFLLYEQLINTTDKMTPVLSKCMKQLDDYEKKGMKNSRPEELQRVFNSIRQSTAELINFKATISELLLNRKK